MRKLSSLSKLYSLSVLARLGKAICIAGLVLAITAGPHGASAFDRDGYKSRAEVTLAELNSKRLKSLEDEGAPPAYLELIAAPADRYIYVKRWQSVKKPRLLEQASDKDVEVTKPFEFPGE